ncbi:MAG: hypothetical protein KAK04_14010 [Cyclobacteriaceae bacterium]|nr:hypothetical protein [Cyclobacteriaceae bacterium]
MHPLRVAPLASLWRPRVAALAKLLLRSYFLRRRSKGFYTPVGEQCGFWHWEMARATSLSVTKVGSHQQGY